MEVKIPGKDLVAGKYCQFNVSRGLEFSKNPDFNTSKLSPPFLMADTHCVMSGVVTQCFIRTGRETISLSWTAVVSVARRSV